ncbi:MAG: hypothetical protein J7539_12530 [Niabella sp.]|nr:hypothetical protein [Niabella sp.]
MKNKPQTLRDSNEPYILWLKTDPLRLITQKEINDNKAITTWRKEDWGRVRLQVLSAENGVVRLSVALQKHEKRGILTIKVTDDQLHISCSCGQRVEKLCPHAFAALSRVSWPR